MGLGKTFTGAEKLHRLNGRINLVICQKSKVDDWIEHFFTYYKTDYLIFDLTNKTEFNAFVSYQEQTEPYERIGVINYDLVFRRSELAQIEIDTLMLDESSLIVNESSKRSKFILRRLKFKNIVLLSGTPVNGKYEQLWSQIRLLGWNISKDLYWKQYVDFEWHDNDGFPIKVVKGYKNVDRLKRKLKEYGAQFLKTEEVLNLPKQIEQQIKIPTIKEYRKFRDNSIVEINDETLVGDTVLTKMLYERQLCGHYNEHKLKAFEDLVESTSDRLIVFYNFNAELELLTNIVAELHKSISVINGSAKDLEAYENNDDSVTFVQYQSGSMGLNLQKANKIIYYSPTLSCGNFMQSKKRIHRIGQEKSCFYYYLICSHSIEEKIYKALERGVDYTDELFERGE